jgi:hypothetical protein
MMAGDVVPGEWVRLPDGATFRVAAVEHVGELSRVLVSVSGRRYYLGTNQRVERLRVLPMFAPRPVRRRP